jgi:ABC-type spermidine/putrescine transport system permease subunit II
MEAKHTVELVWGSLLALFYAPLLYLVLWALQNNKAKDWKESLGKFK